ncbi:MAG: alpha/beta hydrolase [Mesorhizobium sp.]
MLRFEKVSLGAVELNVALAGDPAARPIICLHGFPEYWAAWRDVMTDLARDFFVIVPDQRGYNLSTKPQGVDAYKGRALASDIVALAEHFAPGQRIALAGHDWGASVAYAVAMLFPERVSHLIIANGVHPVCFQRAIFDDPAQRAASQYINKLRDPATDQRLVEDGCRRAFRMIEGFSPAPWLIGEVRDGYREAWSQPGAMTAMLNWYRASPVIVPEPGAPAPRSTILNADPAAFQVRCPHLLLWGEADTALRPSCIEGLGEFAADLTVEHIEGATHWILHEKPAVVAGSMRRWLASRSG